MADKAMGLTYETGMNVSPNDDTVAVNGTKKKTCRFCGKTGHLTSRAKACKYNGWSKERVEAEMVSIYTTKATEAAVALSTAVETSQVQSEGTCEVFSVSCDVANMELNS